MRIKSQKKKCQFTKILELYDNVARNKVVNQRKQSWNFKRSMSQEK